MAKICRASITRGGKTIYASTYGLRAFCWDVEDVEAKPKKEKRAPSTKEKRAVPKK